MAQSVTNLIVQHTELLLEVVQVRFQLDFAVISSVIGRRFQLVREFFQVQSTVGNVRNNILLKNCQIPLDNPLWGI